MPTIAPSTHPPSSRIPKGRVGGREGEREGREGGRQEILAVLKRKTTGK